MGSTIIRYVGARLALLLGLAVCGFDLARVAILAQDSAPSAMGVEEVINFALIDHRGQFHELRRSGARAVVLFFTANGCPIAQQSIWKLRSLQRRYLDRGVVFWMINSNFRDNRASIVQEAGQWRSDPLPILKDDTQGVARFLQVTRAGEVIAISTKDWKIFFRGALDDQFDAGAIKPQPTQTYLDRALAEFLAEKPVSKARTVPEGCHINLDEGSDNTLAEVSYAKNVAPILIQKCVSCHRPNDIGSWVMSDYKKVHGMSAMIQEVILARRMPPWGADPHVGRFANDRALTVEEARTLLRWVELGGPRGDGEDPLPAAAKPTPEWPLGHPDYILRMPRENIPAAGVIDLRHHILEAPFTNDVWIGGLDVKPGNRKVVHHVTLRTINPGQTVADPVGFAGWNPGYMSIRYPEGTGKRFKKGVRFHIDLHYTTVGIPQTDQTEIGFYVLSATPKLALESRAAWDAEISIPPGEPNLRASALIAFEQDSWVYDLRPHMHWRGAWFKFELLYPNGTRETLLSVPRYDFNWQTTYILAEPKRVPAGAWMLCSGGFDNSAHNPANPDPAQRLRWGEQSWDEMFIGHFSAANVSTQEH